MANFVQLKVHTRTVTSSDGQASLDGLVRCERQARFVPIGECMHCEMSYGIDRSDREVFLICRAPESAPSSVAPPVSQQPEALLDMAGEIPVSAIMSRNVFCVGTGVSVDELAEVMLTRNISGLPVVDDGGRAIGVVTKSDLLRLLADHHDDGKGHTLIVRLKDGTALDIGAGLRVDVLSGYTVGDIMTPVVFSMHHEASIGRAAAMMAFEGVHRVPITTEDGRVVGLLSSLDVLRFYARQSGYVLPDHGNLGRDGRPSTPESGH